IRTLRNRLGGRAICSLPGDPIRDHCLGLAVGRLAVIWIYRRRRIAATVVRKPSENRTLDSCAHMVAKVVSLERIEVNRDAVAEDFSAQGKRKVAYQLKRA